MASQYINTRLIKACLFVVLSMLSGLVQSVPLIKANAGGDTFNVSDILNIEISIASAVDLYAFQFDVLFDGNVLSTVDVMEGDFFSSTGDSFFYSGDIDNSSGNVSFVANTLISNLVGLDGGGVLAIMQFKADSIGVSGIDVANVILLDSQLRDMEFEVAGQLITVSDANTVPEPGVIYSLALGLVLMRVASSRRVVGETLI